MILRRYFVVAHLSPDLRQSDPAFINRETGCKRALHR